MPIELTAEIKLTGDSYNSYPGDVKIKRYMDEISLEFDDRIIEMSYEELRKVLEIMRAAE